MTSQCVFCHRHAARPARISLDVGRGGVLIHIDGVPAQHCDACGTDGIDGPLSEQISDGIERITRAIESAIAIPVQT